MKIDERRMQAVIHRIEALENAIRPKELQTYIPGVWYDWSGGEPPVEAHVPVRLTMRHTVIGGIVRAESYSWAWTYGRYGPDDIVSFLIVDEEKEKQNKKISDEENPKQNKASLDNCDFGDSTLREDFEAKYASPSGEHGSAHLGCQPGQFVDKPGWREW